MVDSQLIPPISPIVFIVRSFLMVLAPKKPLETVRLCLSSGCMYMILFMANCENDFSYRFEIIYYAAAVFILKATRFTPLKGRFPDLNGMDGM